ncbi:MAG: NAD(P) transhydrogenase subunit alpha [Synechococcus sp. SB0668_bin_15]|nr:NAD(P) transhydrogenase subunit alpha [Synechococcus sp. SB0668_bin_15]MXZ83303.1 NAD(P) transhydrogenase subunit alpha [Synechococcus sp. SB0666_bin_14]MYA91595.1 NAD(P) transhydrogenase subunit alpha [Synechococcus sp. SB0663_bin_10]MYC48913.1 NAD(P) transhydrogenase subunit alpha [Synechococcus sp. SB0662_bin_14]MYG46662.1 NAD(P) transhydrogenase subunit alpha [Synechococcus sp. SB0675_bin_6]MYJ59996.1 NAD(P) transhydrogenase subunit alpha [Synechococcus sp. SB0672_bin_6]MYK90912.1 NAD(
MPLQSTGSSCKVLIPRERRPDEPRVAGSPETTRRLVGKGCVVLVESGAGQASGFSDQDYCKAGAELVEDGWGHCHVALCVGAPDHGRLEVMATGGTVIGLLAPYGNQALVQQLNRRRLSSLSLELLPRISRAQPMDALSSQANIAGYKAVLLAAAALDRYFPMLMTAAGTVQPARVLILGAGVAGLQAVATARRLGAVVHVSDIRPAVKEQVESLGGRFVGPPQVEQPAEANGYAKQASEAFLAAQRQQLSDQLALADVVICTAQVPGRRAPRLISEAMLEHMRPGAVVVDLAVNEGGNCAATVPGQTINRKGVKLIGASDLPCTVPYHASSLYGRNLAALLEQYLQDGVLQLNPQDPLLKDCLLTHNGHCHRDDVVNTSRSV